jgi:dehydrogenase/reductase SDR family member 7B
MKTESLIALFLKNIVEIFIIVLVSILTLVKRIVIDLIVFIFQSYLSEENIHRFYDEKVVLITGSSSGIGEALAKELIQRADVAVLILSGRNQENLQKVIDSCRSVKPKIKYIPWIIDLEKYEAIEDSYKNLTKEYESYGPISVLINNAGISSRGKALDSSIDTIHKVMATNFYASAILTRLVASSMIHSNVAGSIAAITSVQGKLGLPYRTAYSSSKHALQGYYDGIRGELKPHRIVTTVISPGYVNTQLSLNAVNPDGTAYGKMDENTAKGMKAEYAAKEILVAIANKEIDVVLADAKSKAAVYLKNLWPELLAKMVENRK